MKLLRNSFGIASGIICCLATASPVWSQSITADETLSTNVTSQDNLKFNITGGSSAGENLFHSFNQFSVPTGGSAVFDNEPNIKNIISRVTGGSVSHIDGLLHANSSANLFLLNPSGVIFGPNAQLNIGGSFVTSTASRLKFADGKEFNATPPPTPSLLTVNVPIGLQFGESTRGILVQGSNLAVQSGKTLAFVGGEVTLSGGRLIASGGRIELGSVTGPSLVNLTPTNWALGYEGVKNFRDIQLSHKAFVTAFGAGSGDIQLQGRRVALRNGSQILNGSSGLKSGGTLAVNALESVEVIGSSADGQTNSGLLSTTTGTGASGDLTIKTGRLIVQDGGAVSAFTSLKDGAAGKLMVNAAESVEVIGTTADGQIPSVLATGTFGSGVAGSLTVKTGKLIVRDGGVVSASSFGDGAAGNVTVNARKSIEIIGTSVNGQIPSSLRSDAMVLVNVSPSVREQFNISGVVTGKAGDVKITTRQLIIRDGAEIAVSNQGSGNGGKLEVTADFLQLDKGNIIARTASSEGGNIRVEAQGLLLRNGSQISSTALGSGNGGNLTIDTDTLAALENSDITANAARGRGGNIQIQTQGIFRSADSDITASSALGISGVVEVKTLDTNPSLGLVNLPQEVVNVEGLIAQNCSANEGQGKSEFIVTGRGGLPPNPSELFSSDTVLTNLGTRIPEQQNRFNSAIPTNLTSPSPAPIVEAQGWVRSANGEIVLTAQAPDVTPHNPWLTPASCHAS